MKVNQSSERSQRIVWSVNDVVDATGLHRQTIKRMAREGQIAGAFKWTSNGVWQFNRDKLLAQISGDAPATADAEV